MVSGIIKPVFPLSGRDGSATPTGAQGPLPHAKRPGHEALTNREWKVLVRSQASSMLPRSHICQTLHLLCKDLSGVTRRHSFYGPFSTTSVLRQFAGRPGHTEHNHPLSALSLLLVSSCLPPQWETSHSLCPLMHSNLTPTAGCLHASSPLREHRSTIRYPSKSPPSRMPPKIPWGLSTWLRHSFAHVFTSPWLLRSQKLSATHVFCIKE